MSYLELTEKEVSFKNLVEKVKSRLVQKSRETQVKFCFDLIDDDSNGRICAKDLQIFQTQYGGICNVLTQDYNDIGKYLHEKTIGLRLPFNMRLGQSSKGSELSRQKRSTKLIKR